MNLPFVLDIAIGLVFIYLILSLLASEIQELITTVLQWRAVHLKESIHGLLSDNTSSGAENVRQLANKIYANPLIKGINQEAKGWLPQVRKMIFRCLRGMLRFGKNKGIFGHNEISGPSYMASSTFVGCLMDTLHIPALNQQLTKLRLENFLIYELLERYGASSLTELDRNKTTIIRDFESNRLKLSETLDRVAELVKTTNGEAFKAVFGDDTGNDISPRKKEYLLKRLQPSLTEIVQLIIIYNDPEILRMCKEIYEKLQGKGTYEDVRREVMALDAKHDLPEYVEQCLLFYATLKTNDEIRRLLKKLPPLPESLQKTLYALAKNAQGKVVAAEKQLSHLQSELENWFDRSMDRASGVYKRNAKLVAIMIGCTIAVATNADTIFLVNQLAKEQSLRSAVTQAANKVAESVPTPADTPTTPTNGTIPKNYLDREKINAITDNLSLPLGWSEDNLRQQRRESEKWIKSLGPVSMYLPIWVLNLIGWLISGIAISMGASFWYDLLGKFINVRNVGKKPPEANPQPNAVIEVENAPRS